MQHKRFVFVCEFQINFSSERFKLGKMFVEIHLSDLNLPVPFLLLLFNEANNVWTDSQLEPIQSIKLIESFLSPS